MLRSLSKRAHVSRGGRLLAVAAMVAMLTVAGLKHEELDWLSWIFVGAGSVGILGLLLWKSRRSEDITLQQSVIDATRAALAVEMEALDRRRNDFGKVLMAYGEFLEFPDFKNLEATEWKSQVMTDNDVAVRQLVEKESARMMKEFTTGGYWEEGIFQHRLLLADLLKFVETIALIYEPSSLRPLLETNIEAVLKAINRASLQVLLLVEELPLLDLKDYNLRKVYDNIRRAGKVYQKYEELSPLLEPVRYLWQTSKFLITANPILAAGWIAGTELARYGGKKIGKRVIDAYLLTLVKQSLQIIANETAGVFDRHYRYRDPDWIYGVELAHLLSLFPQSRETLRGAFKELGKVPFRSTYDRTFLYRCVVQHVSPKPKLFAQPDLLTGEVREQMARRLERFFRRYVHGRQPEKVREWTTGLRERLRVPLDIEEAVSASETTQELVEGCLESIASYLRGVGNCTPQHTVDLLRLTRTIGLLDRKAAESFLVRIKDSPIDVFFYPDLDPGSDLVRPFLEDLCDLDSKLDERHPRSYWAIKEAADYFRFADWRSLERQLVRGYSNLFSGGLIPESPVSRLPESLSLVLPSFLEEHELVRFVYADVDLRSQNGGSPSSVVISQFSRRFLLGTSQRRLMLLAQNPAKSDEDSHKTLLLWEGEADNMDVKFSSRINAEHCRISGGRWHTSGDASDLGIVLAGKTLKRSRHYFAALRGFCGIGH